MAVLSTLSLNIIAKNDQLTKGLNDSQQKINKFTKATEKAGLNLKGGTMNVKVQGLPKTLNTKIAPVKIDSSKLESALAGFSAGKFIDLLQKLATGNFLDIAKDIGQNIKPLESAGASAVGSGVGSAIGGGAGVAAGLAASKVKSTVDLGIIATRKKLSNFNSDISLLSKAVIDYKNAFIASKFKTSTKLENIDKTIRGIFNGPIERPRTGAKEVIEDPGLLIGLNNLRNKELKELQKQILMLNAAREEEIRSIKALAAKNRFDAKNKMKIIAETTPFTPKITKKVIMNSLAEPPVFRGVRIPVKADNVNSRLADRARASFSKGIRLTDLDSNGFKPLLNAMKAPIAGMIGLGVAVAGAVVAIAGIALAFNSAEKAQNAYNESLKTGTDFFNNLKTQFGGQEVDKELAQDALGLSVVWKEAKDKFSAAFFELGAAFAPLGGYVSLFVDGLTYMIKGITSFVKGIFDIVENLPGFGDIAAQIKASAEGALLDIELAKQKAKPVNKLIDVSDVGESLKPVLPDFKIPNLALIINSVAQSIADIANKTYMQVDGAITERFAPSAAQGSVEEWRIRNAQVSLEKEQVIYLKRISQNLVAPTIVYLD